MISTRFGTRQAKHSPLFLLHFTVKGNKSFHLTFHFHLQLNPLLLFPKSPWISWIPNSCKPGFYLLLCLGSSRVLHVLPAHMGSFHSVTWPWRWTKYQRAIWDQLEDFRNISWKICQESCNKAFKKSSLAFSKSQQLAGDRRYFRVWHGRDFEGKEKKAAPELLFLNLSGDAVRDKSQRGLALEWNSISLGLEPSR